MLLPQCYIVCLHYVRLGLQTAELEPNIDHGKYSNIKKYIQLEKATLSSSPLKLSLIVSFLSTNCKIETNFEHKINFVLNVIKC